MLLFKRVDGYKINRVLFEISRITYHWQIDIGNSERNTSTEFVIDSGIVLNKIPFFPLFNALFLIALMHYPIGGD